jgi:hypothetical protein
METEAGPGNVVAAIASTLRPAAMLVIPTLCTTLLPRTLSPPGTLLLPSTLLLPRACLLLRTLRLLLLPGLLGALLLNLLIPLDLLLPLLDLLIPLNLLLPLLDLLLIPLNLLLPLLDLLLVLLALLLTNLLPFRLALSFVPLVGLLICRDIRPEKQKQGNGTGSSSKLHGNRPPSRSLLGVHADGQSALIMFHGICCLRFGLGFVRRSIQVFGRIVERTHLQRQRI